MKDCTWFIGTFVVIMIMLAACCILVWFLEGHAGLTIFEDGSFILGTWAGCLPGGICN